MTNERNDDQGEEDEELVALAMLTLRLNTPPGQWLSDADDEIFAAFADNGLRGSDAGTSLKTMLQRLVPQSKEAADLMGDLGLEFFNARGEFIGIEGAAGELQDALSGLSQEQRFAAMSALFGADAVRAANVLYTEGAPGVREWIGNVSDSGYAADLAATKMDNLKGDIEQLSGSIETLLISSGEGASGVLRELVQSTTDFVNGIGMIPGPLLNVGVGLAGLAGTGLVFAGAVGTVVPKLQAFNQQLIASGPAGAKMSGHLKSIAGGMASAGTAAGALAATMMVISGAYNEWGNAGTGMGNSAVAGLREDLASGSLTIDEFNARLVELRSQYISVRDEASSTGGWQFWDEDEAEELRAGGEVLSGLAAQMTAVGDQAAYVADQTGEAQGTIHAWLQEQLGAGVVFGSNKDALAAFNEEQLVAAGLGPDVAAGLSAGEQGMVNMTTATADATKALEDWEAQIRAQFDPLFGLLDAQDSSVEAMLAVEDAQRAVNDAHAAGDPWALAEATMALDQAHRDAAKSALDLTVAQQNLLTAVQNGDVEIGEAKAQLDAWVASGAISQGTADIMRSKFDTIAFGVAAIPDLKHTTITADTVAAEAAIARVVSLMDRLRTGAAIPWSTFVGGFGARAAGGPVTAGHPYLVGERGPELMVPDRAGTIIPNHRMPMQAPMPMPAWPAPAGPAAAPSQRRGALALLDRGTTVALNVDGNRLGSIMVDRIDRMREAQG